MTKNFNFSPYKQFLLAFADDYTAHLIDEICKYPNLKQFYNSSPKDYKLILCRLSLLLYITGFDNLYSLSYKFITIPNDVVKSLYCDVKVTVLKLHSLPPIIVKDYINSFFCNDINILSLYV